MDAPASPFANVAVPIAPARERRMHARAFALWESLRGSAPCPRLTAFDPQALPDAAPQSFLIGIDQAGRPPRVHFLGRALAAEAGLSDGEVDLARLSRSSLLGQLSRHLPRVADRAAPLAFEYDGPGLAGAPTAHRGILLPYADAFGCIAYVQGIVGWRRVAEAAPDPTLIAAISAGLALDPAGAAPCPWDLAPGPAADPLSPAQLLASARTWVALAATDRARGDSAHIAALSAAYDLLLATGDPAKTVLASVFGDRPALARARHQAVLAHARRIGLGAGQLQLVLARHPGGLAAFVRAEAQARRPRPIDLPAIAGRICLSPIDGDYLRAVATRLSRAEVAAPLSAVG